jgi:hypothetical protein
MQDPNISQAEVWSLAEDLRHHVNSLQPPGVSSKPGREVSDLLGHVLSNGGRKAPPYAASLTPDVPHFDHVAEHAFRVDDDRKLHTSSEATAETLEDDYDGYRSLYNRQTTVKNYRNWIQSHWRPITHAIFNPVDSIPEILEYSTTSSLQQNRPNPLQRAVPGKASS